MLTAREVYSKYWAAWVNKTFINDPPVTDKDLMEEDEHVWIYEAMEEYANQQKELQAIRESEKRK